MIIFLSNLDDYGWEVCGRHLESPEKCHTRDPEEK